MITGGFKLHVRLFGLQRELAGKPVVEVELDSGATVRDLKTALGRHPALERGTDRAAVAVNRRYAADDEPVKAGDEVALIPPVAGG